MEPQARGRVIQILRFLLSIVLLQGGPIASEARQETAKSSAPARPQTSTSAACEATGSTEIKLDCSYVAPTGGRANASDRPSILLSHAKIDFEPREESHMKIELTFTNDGGAALKESRTVYIAFDDEGGLNHIRRPLPHVDLQKLSAGGRLAFSDQFIAPGLQPGRYFVRLWIPSLDAKLKFDPSQNFLLGNQGLADPSSGLNEIATIHVEVSKAAAHRRVD